MLKVTVVMGTRPEAIKLIPVCKELKNDPYFEVRIVSTGQHQEMLESVFDFFDIQPDVDLDLMTRNQSLAKFTAKAINALDDEIASHMPNILIVQGDTTTAMTAGLVGYYYKVKIAHVEAGLRTNNKYSPFPEEVNRKVISSFTDFHFAPTAMAKEVLINEGYSNTFITGNTTIDSLLYAKNKVTENPHIYEEKFRKLISNDGMVLLTGHRRESFGQGFDLICESIASLAKLFSKLSFIYPVHLNPYVHEIVSQKLGGISNIHLLEPVPYDEMVYLMTNSKLILTDSGGIQEEAPSLNVPVVVMRNHTERMEGVEAGCSVLAGVSSDITKIASQILNDKRLYDSMSMAINPFGDGYSSKRIVELLKEPIKM